MKKSSKPIGLIGGMGPFASAYFYKLLLKKSSVLYGAKNNDDFPEIIIDSVPVPDFISNTNDLKTAKNMLISRVKKLNKFGVICLAMICNTGHLLYDDLSKISKSEFISIIQLSAIEASKRKYKKVGILATPTTVKFNLYGKLLEKMGIEAKYPSKNVQKLHEQIIREVLAGRTHPEYINKLTSETNKFIEEQKLDGIILGCTEFPIVFPRGEFDNKVVDSMEVLADELLLRYYK